MKVFLIGYMAAGKSTLGGELATTLAWPLTDLDEKVEEELKMPVGEIFVQKGEAAFRKAETRALHALYDPGNEVIATGGGTPCHSGNMQWMNERGITLWIDAPFSLVCQRLENDSQRPLWRAMEKPDSREVHFNERRMCYSQSAWKIPAPWTSDDLQRLVERVREAQSR